MGREALSNGRWFPFKDEPWEMAHGRVDMHFGLKKKAAHLPNIWLI